MERKFDGLTSGVEGLKGTIWRRNRRRRSIISNRLSRFSGSVNLQKEKLSKKSATKNPKE